MIVHNPMYFATARTKEELQKVCDILEERNFRLVESYGKIGHHTVIYKHEGNGFPPMYIEYISSGIEKRIA